MIAVVTTEMKERKKINCHIPVVFLYGNFLVWLKIKNKNLVAFLFFVACLVDSFDCAVYPVFF